nr:glycosyl transferase [Lachnospiraceae bacterium]
MDRDSFLYKLRRRMQICAYKVVPNETLSKFYYKIVMHEKLNIKEPKTFNEKLQWMKLYYFPKNQLVADCSDKYKVREYIKDKGYENILVPLIGYWRDARDIEWEKLPDKFVLKCNHG